MNDKDYMDLPILYAWYKDIIFHVLTHMKVDNASNIFNEIYVQEIGQEKKRLGITEDLIGRIEALTDYYMEHFERLAVINFIPFITNSFEELTQTIINWGSFTEEDKVNFINEFITILEEESAFYHGYWHQKDNMLKHRKSIVEKNLNDKLMLFKCMFDYYKQCKHMKVEVLLSYSMGQNGRGSSNQNAQLVALPFPFDENNEEDTFFMALHELTHPCTDDLVGKDISMKDGSHALTENIVMIADYEIIKKVNPILVESYFKWICNKSGNPTVQLDEDMFYNVFVIPIHIKEELKERIKEIVEFIN